MFNFRTSGLRLYPRNKVILNNQVKCHRKKVELREWTFVQWQTIDCLESDYFGNIPIHEMIKDIKTQLRRELTSDQKTIYNSDSSRGLCSYL